MFNCGSLDTCSKSFDLQRGNSPNMGQRDGFASSDVEKINKMYQCTNQPTSQGIFKPTHPRPSYQKPNRPNRPVTGTSSGGGGGGSSGGFTNPIAQFVGGLAGFFHGLGGRNDGEENFDETNNFDEH